MCVCVRAAAQQTPAGVRRREIDRSHLPQPPHRSIESLANQSNPPVESLIHQSTGHRARWLAEPRSPRYFMKQSINP